MGKTKIYQGRKALIKTTALLLAVILAVFVPENVSFNCEGSLSVAIELSTVQAATAITVKSADKSTAEKLHDKLMKGKALSLKVKGNKSKSKALLKKLNKKLKKVNEQGVVFEYSAGSTSSGYTTYNVSSDQAGTYKYAVKFIKKLYGKLRDSMTSDKDILNMVADMELYPKEETRLKRYAYDYFVRKITSDVESANYYSNAIWDVSTFDPVTTKFSGILFSGECGDSSDTRLKLGHVTYKEATTYVVCVIIGNDNSDLYTGCYTVEGGYSEETENQCIEKAKAEAVAQYGQYSYAFCEDSYSDQTTYIQGLTFDEFKDTEVAAKLIKSIRFVTNVDDRWKVISVPSDQDLMILKTEKFCDLSDAMKVYAIAASGYFYCKWERSGYGQIYAMVYKTYSGKKGMKILYDNKAEGVCMVFASNEILVWKALGLSCYYMANNYINHAWSVVKVKNSNGKTLWIPFDYGIGPAENLAVSEEVRDKYLKTEAMRYKLYLKGIKGAPGKKNFSTSDFN